MRRGGRGWELGPLVLASNLRFPFFQRDFVSNRGSAFNTNSACKYRGFTNSAFCVGGGGAALAVMLVAWLLCSQLHPGLSRGNNNPLQPSGWVIVVPWWLQSSGDCSTVNSLGLQSLGEWMKCILSSHSSLCKLQIADEKKINAKIFTTPSFSVVSRQTGEAEDGMCWRGAGGGALLLPRISRFAFPLNLVSLYSHPVLVSFTVCSPLSCLGMLRSSKVYPSWFTYSIWVATSCHRAPSLHRAANSWLSNL